MMSSTIKYGIRNAPPPFSNAVNGNLQMLPRPTDIAMQLIKNSTSLPQLARSLGAFVVVAAVSVADAVAADLVDVAELLPDKPVVDTTFYCHIPLQHKFQIDKTNKANN